MDLPKGASLQTWKKTLAGSLGEEFMEKGIDFLFLEWLASDLP
jgi:hypothetical protein